SPPGYRPDTKRPMNFVQLLKFAVGGLWRQKVRTALTLVGVMVGTCALAFSVSLGLGLRAFIDTEFKGRDDFWRVIVLVDQPPPDESTIPPDKLAVQGKMSDDRRDRLREALADQFQADEVRRGRRPRAPNLLTPDKLDTIARMPGVTEIRAFRVAQGHMRLGSEQTRPLMATSGPLADLSPRLVAGRLPSGPDAREVVVSEFALYQIGIRDDEELERAVGREVVLEVGEVENAPTLALAVALIGQRPPDELDPAQREALDKLVGEMRKNIDAFNLTPAEKLSLARLLAASNAPARTTAGTFTVCGVTRILTRAEKKKTTPLDSSELVAGDVFLPTETGDKLFARLPWVKEGTYLRADVRLSPDSDLPGTVARIEALGFRTYSGAKWFAAAKREVTLIAAGLNLFAFIALFVAAVGITNTLVTSVVERTKEIGILRAVGATRGQIMSLFLTEGALIGALGGLLGLGLGYALTLWADRWVQSLIAGQMDGQKMLSTTVFVFPSWLWLGSVGFAVGVTTLAALYPARRAARIHPIEALRFG
ncbi:MAG: ABC transporter permease, partial [Gemmataceae bacterium]|nr:ABC transporter permease [Gemmataceae bacterium]